MLKSLLPDFSVGCRRLTPGPSYLQACMQPNVEYIGTAIDPCTETGNVTSGGKQRDVDVIICATGFDV